VVDREDITRDESYGPASWEKITNKKTATRCQKKDKLKVSNQKKRGKNSAGQPAGKKSERDKKWLL
jgi:hypothetical protein